MNLEAINIIRELCVMRWIRFSNSPHEPFSLLSIRSVHSVIFPRILFLSRLSLIVLIELIWPHFCVSVPGCRQTYHMHADICVRQWMSTAFASFASFASFFLYFFQPQNAKAPGAALLCACRLYYFSLVYFAIKWARPVLGIHISRQTLRGNILLLCLPLRNIEKTNGGVADATVAPAQYHWPVQRTCNTYCHQIEYISSQYLCEASIRTRSACVGTRYQWHITMIAGQLSRAHTFSLTPALRVPRVYRSIIIFPVSIR